VGSDAAGTMLVVSTAYGGSDVRIERRDPVTGALIRSTPPTSAVTAPGIGGVIGSGCARASAIWNYPPVIVVDPCLVVDPGDSSTGNRP
jgi:hypothetical protein